MSQLDNPSQWATGAEPPTTKQTSFLETLASQKGADIDPSNLSKAEASSAINDLKNKETTNSEAAPGGAIQDPKGWAT